MIEELSIFGHTFVNILSINVAEEVVTLVGWRMAGKKWSEINTSRKLFVFGGVLCLSRSRLKSPKRITSFLFTVSSDTSSTNSSLNVKGLLPGGLYITPSISWTDEKSLYELEAGLMKGFLVN